MNISIKNVPEPLVDQLRRRAKKNHRSLQGEVMALLEEAVAPERVIMKEARRRLTDLGYQTGAESKGMLREDRDGR